MQLFLQNILSAIPIYKYGLLFLFVMIEGPFVTMMAGWIAFLGYLNPFLAYAVIVCADITSDSVYYFIGFWGRKKITQKDSQYSHKSVAKLKKIEHLLLHHSGKTIVITKLTHVAGVPFLIAAGMAKIRFFTFLLYDFLATVPKSLAFVLLGYYFGRSTGIINQYLEYGTFLISALIVAIFIAYLFVGRYVDEKVIKID